MLVPVLLFLVGFALLIKGGDWFVDGSVGIAHRFHLPELLIGATIVSIGTTLPEVMVSAQAAAQGSAGISYGNAIGSIICNTSLIAAITVAAKPGKVDPKSFRLPAAFFFGAAITYSLVAWTYGRFERWMGIAYLIVFVAYMVISTLHMKKHPELAEADEELVEEVEEIEEKIDDLEEKPAAAEEKDSSEKERALWQELVMLAVGAAAIALGAHFLVDNGTLIAAALGVPDSVIGLTMVALGTSLPELITAITSLAKGHGALSLGNVIGANLFNIILVSGMAITISPFAVPAEKTLAGMNASLIVDIPLMLFVMALLCVPALLKGKLHRLQGIALLCIYAAFTVFQFVS
ncbi:MAG: calcium/sodium antiporter [Lachnospiraceae bacterium]|nr:calcium/sodium antiporter [Lachnospiraceae bacterium]